METAAATNRPTCGNCGYDLTGLTESSKCPECGRPIVEVLTRPAFGPNFGRRYRSKATLFGWPVIDIAIGPKDGQMRGHAKGIIAIGDIATGGVAFGGVARGVVAIGGFAVGGFAVGGGAIGAVSAVGGLAVGALASGGGAIGVLANGGGALGLYAQGGGALGLHTRDGRTPFGPPPSDDPFAHLTWFFGAWPPSPATILGPMSITLGLAILVGAIIGAIALIKWNREPGKG